MNTGDEKDTPIRIIKIKPLMICCCGKTVL